MMLDHLMPAYRLELDRLRKSRYMDYPQEVAIETQAVCNAACSFCPYPGIERKGQKMPDSMVEKIIRDLEDIPKDLPFTISPFKVNDPLLDVRIFDIMGEINSRLPSASLRFFTNGSPLTEKNVDRLARVLNLAHLWVSLNTHDEDEYEKIMQLPLARTLENLDMLHRKKAAGEFPRQVVLSRVRDASPQDQEFDAFCKARYPLFSTLSIYRAEWLGQVPGLFSSETVPAIGCQRWFEMSLMATGKAAFCCMDGKGEHPIGDVSKAHVLDVYNDPVYRRFREKFNTRAEGSPCRSCTQL